MFVLKAVGINTSGESTDSGAEWTSLVVRMEARAGQEAIGRLTYTCYHVQMRQAMGRSRWCV